MSTDGGTVWEQKDSYYNDGGCCIVHPDSANVILTGGQGQTNSPFTVSYSRDGGNSWTRCDLSSSQRGFCYALAMAPSATEVIYAAGQVNGSGAVYRSTDRGISWSRTATSPAGIVFGLAVLPTDPSRVVAATLSGAFITTDAGTTWSNLGAGTAYRAVALHPFGPDTLVVAGDLGVKISRDGGQSWTAMNDGLETLAVNSVGFVGDGGTQLIAGTAGRGCFVWSFSSGIVEGGKPQATSLKPQVTILRGQLMLPASGVMRDASNVLLDVNGRGVMDLQAGPNDVSLLAPGVYFVRLADNGNRQTVKVVVQR